MTLVDGRSHRIVLVAHCLLNANAKAEGSSWYAGVHAIIGEIAGRGYSLVQLPCPESRHMGPSRELLDPGIFQTEEYRQLCSDLAADVLAEVDLYQKAGVKTVAVVGIEGGPSCALFEPKETEGGVGTGPGVFTIELQKRLEPQGVRFLSVSHALREDNVPAVIAGLR